MKNSPYHFLGNYDLPKSFDRKHPIKEIPKSSEIPNYHGNPQPSFLGVITHILRFKTFIFHGFGVQG